MDRPKCDKCGKEFYYGEQMWICNQCGAALCFSCSGAGKTTICPKCERGTELREQKCNV